ncbi:MAG: (2Fe-2S)-binding protein [Verrucomicrobiota bacterium]
MIDSISFTLNDQPLELKVDGDRTLLWVLRADLGLTGTKYGCGEGHCGCCTVLVDGSATRACLHKVREVAGKKVQTIEGLEHDGKLHPVQKAFMEHDALQCGFCIPGQVMNAVALLSKTPLPTREQIARGMENNFCRCGAHTRILDAIQSAAAEMKGGKR